MSAKLTEIPLATCEYCGRENKERSSHCGGCGTRLVAQAPAPAPELKARSESIAVMLVLIFGPLGLIYVRAWGTAVLMIVIGLVFMLTHHGGLWLMIGARVIGAALAYSFARKLNENPEIAPDPERLLNQASRWEGLDQERAIAIYNEIISLYPDTTASREAARNIEVLNRNATKAERGQS